jgi:preprotein translocase subunit SecD
MKLNCRLVLIALASLFWISACMADELVAVLNSATAGHDERTGKPVLNLVFAEVSKVRLRTFFADNLGQRVDLRIGGRVVLSSVVREPLDVHVQLSNPDWTDEAATELARQLSEAPKGEVELRPSSSSN